MPSKLNKQQERILKLAQKGGNDATLMVLNEVNDLEKRVDEMEKNTPDLNKVLESVRGTAGKDGTEGKKGDAGKDGKDGKDGRDGKDGVDGKDAKAPSNAELQKLIEPLIPAAEVIDEASIANQVQARVEQHLPALGAAVRDALELLDGEDRLNVSAIEGIETLQEDIKKAVKNGGGQIGWGAHPLTIQQSGVTKAKVARVINFTGATVSLNASGVITVAITGGSGWTKEAMVGTIDGVNKTFTVTATPQYIVVDGITYFENSGYTLSGLTVTTTVAPTGFAYDIY